MKRRFVICSSLYQFFVLEVCHNFTRQEIWDLFENWFLNRSFWRKDQSNKSLIYETFKVQNCQKFSEVFSFTRNIIYPIKTQNKEEINKNSEETILFSTYMVALYVDSTTTTSYVTHSMLIGIETYSEVKLC